MPLAASGAARGLLWGWCGLRWLVAAEQGVVIYFRVAHDLPGRVQVGQCLFVCGFRAQELHSRVLGAVAPPGFALAARSVQQAQRVAQGLQGILEMFNGDGLHDRVGVQRLHNVQRATGGAGELTVAAQQAAVANVQSQDDHGVVGVCDAILHGLPEQTVVFGVV